MIEWEQNCNKTYCTNGWKLNWEIRPRKLDSCRQQLTHKTPLTDNYLSFHWIWTFMKQFFGVFFSNRLLSVLRGHAGFFIPTTTANDLRLPKIFYPRFYPLHLFSVFILEKEPVFPFLMFSAKQESYWYHLYNVFGMTRSLTGDWTRDLPHSKPALYH